MLVVDIYRNSRGAKIADYAATIPDWIAPNHDTGQIFKTVHGLWKRPESITVQVQPSKGVQPGQVDSGQLVAKELQFLKQAQLVKLGWEGTQFVTSKRQHAEKAQLGYLRGYLNGTKGKKEGIGPLRG